MNAYIGVARSLKADSFSNDVAVVISSLCRSDFCPCDWIGLSAIISAKTDYSYYYYLKAKYHFLCSASLWQKERQGIVTWLNLWIYFLLVWRQDLVFSFSLCYWSCTFLWRQVKGNVVGTKYVCIRHTKSLLIQLPSRCAATTSCHFIVGFASQRFLPSDVKEEVGVVYLLFLTFLSQLWP